MKLPKISIVTPSYNQGQFLEETIQSVLNQNYPDLEYFVIDGGSTDNSVDIIKKYQDQITYWVSEPDRGQSDAINKGFRRSTGEIVAWLCSDDTYFPGALKSAGTFFSKHPEVDVVYGDVAAIDEKSRIFAATRSLNFSLLGLLSRSGSISQSASFFRRKILDQVGFIDESMDYCMDYEFYLRAAIARFNFQRIPKTLATYRYHSASKTVTGTSVHNKHNEAMERHQKKYADGHYNLVTLKFMRKILNLQRIILNLDRYWQYRNGYLKSFLSRL